ncbi:hypothetical protein GSI_08361 [Ganoderma sinense ZZ0214-1]|uniref:FAT domain-containing protein n=1 Tax=Ganoderma sinense ZZ0214-1 TaxID=1077348 RepID=A0A2G8S702_9APHY|nr:hypothetical protein GSI_08361 [Ganoderma sinense ZZ0214-1]
MAAAAVWALNNWESMDDYIQTIKPDSADRPFYRAILAVHQNQFPKAMQQIAKARDLLDPELTSLAGESYSRSYNTMVWAQMLSEPEEIVNYKQHADQPDRQAGMRKTWMKRLQGCQPDVEVWQRILQVRALVLSPEDDPVMWIKFANLCRKSDRMFLAEKTINSLLFPDRRNIKNILQSYYLATHYDASWYKAWHTWALANFEVVGFLVENEQYNKISDVPDNDLTAHIVSAVNGFFRSISLRNENALQGTLRLLTLWFKYGAHEDVSYAMSNGFTDVEVDTWLEVIPQIIACIQTPSNNIRRTINNLLTEVGKHHPQALVYAFIVASKPSSAVWKTAALHIVDRMRDHSPFIVEQALLVSHELVRVAIFWHKLWHEGLEEALCLYFTDHNLMGMIAFLESLHDMLEGPKTVREISFTQVFGRDLHEAREAC